CERLNRCGRYPVRLTVASWIVSGGNGLESRVYEHSDRPKHVACDAAHFEVDIRRGSTHYHSETDQLRLIRFGGHLPKGRYDVHTDGRHDEKPALTRSDKQ